jgi:hypothetical protein
MHELSLLSKEVSDIHDFYYHFLNDQFFCSYLNFHDFFLLPSVLSSIHSLLASTTDLGFTSFENLFGFFLSSSSHFLLCNSTLIFSSFSKSLLMFLVPLCSYAHLILYLHYQH